MLIAAWSEFLGANTRLTAKRLPEGVGVFAINLRLGSADLRPWNTAQTVVTTGGATPLISAYRMGRSTPSDTANWLQWTTDVDVARSLIGNDTTEEFYYTGDGIPKRSNTTLALPGAPGPAASRSLGIPKPAAAMTATVLAAGTGTSQSRVYVDTYVNDQGRESAPGTARTLSCLGGSTVTLGSLDTTPTSGYPDVTLRRIYCSTDGGSYLRVLEQAVATTTATDNLARGTVLPSGGDTSKPAWEMPPTNLAGLTGLWNGMIGGFFGKTYTVCEPNKPWAWPVEYQETVLDDIVGTGKWQNNWLILTNAQPYLVSGSSPLNMNNTPIEFLQSCVSKRSIVSMGHGVCWASPNGLCYMGQNGARLLTDSLMTPEQWGTLAPSTMIGARFENYYLGFYDDGTGPIKAFSIDPLNPSGIVTITQGARGRYFDPVSERLYLQDVGNVIRRWHYPNASGFQAWFKTGIKRAASMTNPGCAMVIADAPVSVTVTIWANVLQASGALAWTQVFARTVTTGEMFALPSGYLAQEYQAQLTTSGPVNALLLAEEPADLI